ncbi:hypothetical protein WQ54_15305 [Bacillus sp. SA1-12]|uniref:hypothetical protein n=1 Tax=Bacillus sp. SA1-12 TaxID=1455638 RepID=UPI000627168F|nr:hypothetical protein [Bacillus sp. SA1-12]KKI91387.1 hypothetical protein WQ54_15305 [Bacillus sp. SA1-12]
MEKKIVIIFILLPIISVIFVSVTPFLIKANVENYEEFKDAKFGFPIPYVRQNLLESGSDYEGGFPHQFGLQMDYLDEDPEFKFILTNYFLSFSIIYICLLVSCFLVQKGRKLLK